MLYLIFLFRLILNVVCLLIFNLKYSNYIIKFHGLISGTTYYSIIWSIIVNTWYIPISILNCYWLIMRKANDYFILFRSYVTDSD